MRQKLYKIKKTIKDPSILIARLWANLSRYIRSDYLYLQVYYFLKMKEKMKLNAPDTYQQKLQWLKLNNRDPSYTQMADKFGVRDIIKNKIGEKYLIPILGHWDNFGDINFDLLPQQFVLKTTHDSGNIVIVIDKKKFLSNGGLKEAKKKLSGALKYNYYYAGREYQYKDIKPRIIAEKFM